MACHASRLCSKGRNGVILREPRMPVNMAGLGSEDSSGLEIGLDKYYKAYERSPAPVLGHDISDRKGTEADLSGGHG